MSDLTGIYIGTSGWSYPAGEGSWNGTFYPPGTKNELQYYSQFFKTVELNSTFYRPPAAAYARQWARRTPEDFIFTVKLWQKFTHPKMYESATGEAAVISQADVSLFQKGIAPLVESGKLGALLAQFPPSFKNDDNGKQVLTAVLKTFGDYRLAVELRHRSWSDDTGTMTLLHQHNAAWVQIDEPKFASSIARELPETGDIAYFRFHGRNAANWWQGNSETRYKYLYSEAEMAELSQKVKAASDSARLVFAFFNNHWKGYAPRNAVDMMKSLELPFTDLPATGSSLFPAE